MNIFVLSAALFILPMQEFDVLNEHGKKEFPAVPFTKEELISNLDYFLIVNDGIKPLKSPGKDSEPSGAPPMKFCEKIFQAIAGPIQKDDKQYYLACRYEGDNKLVIHGWIPDDSILFNFDAKVSDGTGITRKALIINSKEWIINNGNKLPVPLKGFLEESGKNQPIRFFNIMFVYKELFSKDPEKHQFLLGFDPSIPKAINAPDILAGWVPAKALCQWNTRQAIQWNDDNKKAGVVDPRTSIGKIFKTDKDLEAFTNQLQNEKIEPLGLLGSEIVDKTTGFSIPWGIDQPRYPILELTPNQRALNLGKFGQVLKIGMIGNFQKSDGTFVNAQEVSNERERGRNIKEGMEQTYILFVIDDTSSMDAAFNKIVPECIKNVIKTVKDLNKVKVAVCFYNDFNNKSPRKSLDETVKFHEWVPLSLGLKSPVIKMLEEHKTKDGGDPLEQPIHGLLHGLTKASVEPPSWSRKVVFVIGDMGNHLKGNLDQNIEKDSQKIAELLTPVNNSPWEFLPLQVPHARGEDVALKDPDYKLYKKQMDYIAELFRIRREKAVENIADIKLETKVSTITLQNYDNLLSELNKRTNLYEEKKVKIIIQLENLVRGTFVPGSKFSNEVLEAFNAENVNVKLLSEGGYQIFEEGWVTQLDGEERPKAQIKTMLFMERSAFNDIAKILKIVVKNWKTNDLEIVTNAVIKALTGDRDNFKDLNEVEKAIKGIMFNSQLLKLLFDKGLKGNLKNVLLGPKALADNMLRLSYLKELSEDIGNNQISEYEIIQIILENNFKVPAYARVIGTTRNQQRFFKPIGSNSNDDKTKLEFIWLDNDKEFP